MANGVGSAAFKGVLSGAGTGGQIGENVGQAVGSVIPGVGPMLGKAAGATLGRGIGALAGGISGAIGQNKSNQAQQIPFFDPMEQQRLAQLNQARKSIMVGTDPATQMAMQGAQNAGRAAQNAIVRSTGGDASTTLDALLKAQQNVQAASGQAVAQGQQQLPYFDNAYGQLLQRTAQRKLELQLLKRAQATAQAAQQQKENAVNANALMATQAIPMESGLQKMEQITSSPIINTPMVQGLPQSNTISDMNWAGGLTNQSLPTIPY